MNDDILDTQAHFNADNLDSKTRIKISDAIIEVNDQLKKVKFGRYLLFGLAVINFFIPLLSLITSDNITPDVLYGSALILGIVVLPFVIFGILYPRNPLIFLSLGLAVYLVFLVLGSMLTGGGVANGFAWKAGTLTAFGVTLYGVSVWKRNLLQLKELGYPASSVAEAQKKLKPIPRLKKRKKT